MIQCSASSSQVTPLKDSREAIHNTTSFEATSISQTMKHGPINQLRSSVSISSSSEQANILEPEKATVKKHSMAAAIRVIEADVPSTLEETKSSDTTPPRSETPAYKHTVEVKPSHRRSLKRSNQALSNFDGNTVSDAGHSYSSVSESMPCDRISGGRSKALRSKKQKSDETDSTENMDSVTSWPNDPNHFLNQSWWRHTSKKRSKPSLRFTSQFDLQQCMVSNELSPVESTYKMTNNQAKDIVPVTRGSRRLRNLEKDQLKLCCPICRKQFKARFGIASLTEDVIARHVAKCSKKAVETNMRIPENEPQNIDSLLPQIPAQTDTINFTVKPRDPMEPGHPLEPVDPMERKADMQKLSVLLPSNGRADRAVCDAARAQSNQFLMHGRGKLAFEAMLLENNE